MVLVRRSLASLCSVLALTALAGGCADDKGAPPERTGTTGTTAAATVVADPQPTPREHLSDAVRDLLAAEQRNDREASFLFLSRQSRVAYKDLGDWTRRRQELPAVKAFRIEPRSEGDKGDGAGKVAALVEHEPGLDPFQGLSFAREIQTFTGRQEGGGWLVDADPAVEPLLPPEPLAVDAATSWVAAVQSCDKAKAAGLQAVATLFGTAEGAVGLCGKQGPVTPGAVGPLAPGIASTDIVAQYTTDALSWGRVVRITSPAAFGVVLAPVGERWQVLGLTE